MLRLAAQLRREAADLGRADVVAEVDEVITLIAGSANGRSADAEGVGRAAAIVKFLDGLGF